MAGTALVLLLLGAWLLILGAFARRLVADWREPVLSTPVLIIESDDWGPGPPEDAARLRQLGGLLQEFRDGRGHHPMVTLGIVLAVPDAAAGQGEGGRPAYVPRALDRLEFAPVVRAMLSGRDAGVFALQLHGMEHFWPPAVLKAAQRDVALRAFFDKENVWPRHESLPAHLQTRWIDASELPSAPLRREDIEHAAAEETECFARVFGECARVVVPVTFTWTMDVESAWARHGVRVVVSPGCRNVGRDRQGKLIDDGAIIRNGARGPGNLVYVVRDVYFEPAKGHRAEAVLDEILSRHRLGRPALLEMHRFNFIGDETQAERSLAELRRLLQLSLERIPRLRFMSTETLALALTEQRSRLIDRRLAARIRALVLRASTIPRLRKLAWLSGLALPAMLALAISSVLGPPSAIEEGLQ